MDWGAVIAFLIAIAGAKYLSGGSFIVGVIAFFIIFLPLGIILPKIFKMKRSGGDPGPGGGGGCGGTKIYRGYSYDLAYRVEDGKIYRGYSYDRVYRIEGDKIYHGYGYDLAFRIEGDKIYRGYSYDLVYRVEGDKIYSGYGYDLEYRVDY
jgi:hypothetical protein